MYSAVRFIKDSIETIAKKFYSVNLEALDQTMAFMSYKDIKEAAQLIRKAKKIHIIGIGHSGMTAQETKYKFMRIGINTDVYTDEHTMIMMASIMEKEDLVFAISHSGNTKEIITTLKMTKEVGAKSICVVSNAHSKVEKYANYIIPYVSKETLFQTGAVSTKIAQSFVIDLIYTEVIRFSLQTAVEKKIRTSKALRALDRNDN